MLITVNSITGIGYINPDQITHVDPMRDSVIIHFSDQSMVVVLQAEWDRIAGLVIASPTRLQNDYDQALEVVFKQQRRIEELEAQFEDDEDPGPDPDDHLDDNGLPF